MNKTSITQQTNSASFFPHSNGLLQRKCACGNHVPGGGICSTCARSKHEGKNIRDRDFAERVSAIPSSGPQIAVSEPFDAHEIEAEATARALFPVSASRENSAVPAVLQRQTDAAPEAKGIDFSGIRASSGQPLPVVTRKEMEDAFGTDFSSVRIHTDDRAARLSRSLGAKAFTFGNEIFFGESQFESNSLAGKRLIAHELTHTLQQRETFGQISRQASGRTALQCVNDNLASMGVAAWLITIVGGACGLIGALAGSPTGPGAAGTAAFGAILCIAGLTGLSIGMVSRVVSECRRDPNARVGLPGTLAQAPTSDSVRETSA